MLRKGKYLQIVHYHSYKFNFLSNEGRTEFKFRFWVKLGFISLTMYFISPVKYNKYR